MTMVTMLEGVINPLVEEYAAADMLDELERNEKFKAARMLESVLTPVDHARNMVMTIEDEVNWEMINW